MPQKLTIEMFHGPPRQEASSRLVSGSLCPKKWQACETSSIPLTTKISILSLHRPLPIPETPDSEDCCFPKPYNKLADVIARSWVTADDSAPYISR